MAVFLSSPCLSLPFLSYLLLYWALQHPDDALWVQTTLCVMLCIGLIYPFLPPQKAQQKQPECGQNMGFCCCCCLLSFNFCYLNEKVRSFAGEIYI